jgi:hypothetical protein
LIAVGDDGGLARSPPPPPLPCVLPVCSVSAGVHVSTQ